MDHFALRDQEGRCLPDGVGDGAAALVNASYARLHGLLAQQEAARAFVFGFAPRSASPSRQADPQ